MRKALRARGRSGRSVARVLRWSPLSIVLVVLVVGSGAPAHLTATESGGAAATSATALPHLAIIFAANSTAEVRALIGDHRYIQPGDAFDLDSGSPSNVALSVSHIDQWARMLHAAYPGAMIYAHTSGIAHYTTLAKRAGPDVSGVYYDYEPEVTANFTPTLAEFTKITAIAHRYGLESIGYPTGQPILSTSYRSDDGQFPQLSAAVDQLVIDWPLPAGELVLSDRDAAAPTLEQVRASGLLPGWDQTPP
ncbi:MAG: hypothetical protein ACRECT_00080 [Thermoplasmata archaeon]